MPCILGRTEWGQQENVSEEYFKRNSNDPFQFYLNTGHIFEDAYEARFL